MNLQRTMQRSNPEQALGPAPLDGDGDPRDSSRHHETAAGGCAATWTSCLPPSGGACGSGDEESCGWHEQTPVVRQEHLAGTRRAVL